MRVRQILRRRKRSQVSSARTKRFKVAEMNDAIPPCRGALPLALPLGGREGSLRGDGGDMRQICRSRGPSNPALSCDPLVVP